MLTCKSIFNKIKNSATSNLSDTKFRLSQKKKNQYDFSFHIDAQFTEKLKWRSHKKLQQNRNSSDFGSAKVS